MGNTQPVQVSNKNPSVAFERRVFFDRLQRDDPDILMPDLDPDPPVPLASDLEKFDRPIMNLLTQILPTDQSKASPADLFPLPSVGIPKATCLAKKLASGHSGLTKDDIDNVAARIGWLLRNWFRRDARDGYAKCLRGNRPRPKKSGASAARTRTTTPQAGGTTTGPPQRATPQSEGPQPPLQITNPSLPSPSSDLPDEQFQGAGESVNPTHPGLFGAQEQCAPLSSNLVEIPPADEDDFTFGVRSMDGRDLSIQPNPIAAGRAEWQREIEEYRPPTIPQIPPKPSIFPNEVEASLARSFLWGVYYQNDVQILTNRARRLVADSDQLSLALSHSETARKDILKSLAFLGIDLC